MIRRKAALIHLAISVMIASATIGLIWFVWYPAPFFNAIGGQLLLTLIIGIDVCIGPLLTFIIFNPLKSKRQLLLDMSIIAILQAGALVYGLYATFEGRPVYVVYAQGHFVTVTANTIDEQMLRDVPDPRFKKLPLWGPLWVGAKLPADAQELSDLNFNWAITGMGVHYQPKYFVGLPVFRDEIIRVSKPLETLQHQNSEVDKLLDRSLARINKKSDEVGFIPLNAQHLSLIVLIDKKSGAVLDALNIDSRLGRKN